MSKIKSCEFCYEKKCICIFHECVICNKKLPESEIYEYRGVHACHEHLDEATEKRDYQRNEIIKEQIRRTEPLKGLNFDPRERLGRANLELLAPQLEIAKTETYQEKQYRKGKL